MKSKTLVALLATLTFLGPGVLTHELPVENEDSEAVEIDAGSPYEIVEVSDEEDIDVGQVLGAILESEDQQIEVDDEDNEQSYRENRALEEEKAEEKSGKFEPAVIAKYNGFIDAFLRRLSTSLRARDDPLTIVIRKSGQVVARNAKAKPKGRGKKKGGGKRKNKRRKGNKKRKRQAGRRHPKSLTLGEETEDTEEGEETDAEQTPEEIDNEEEEEATEETRVKRSTDLEEEDTEDQEEEEEETEVLDREERSLTEEDSEGDETDGDDEELEEEDEEETEVSAREGREMQLEQEGKNDPSSSNVKAVNRRGKAGRRRRRRKGGKRKRGKCGPKCRRRRKRLRNRRRKGNRGKRSVAGSKAILSGVSSLRRIGDVQIIEKKGGTVQNIHADIKVGPFLLKTEKTYGKGKSAVYRKAEAIAPDVKGKLIISVTNDGTARVKNFNIFRPTSIRVSGSIRRDGSRQSDKFMQSYVKRASPVISKRMKAAARKLLQISNAGRRNRNKN